jgi:hypothetical protein
MTAKLDGSRSRKSSGSLGLNISKSFYNKEALAIYVSNLQKIVDQGEISQLTMTIHQDEFGDSCVLTVIITYSGDTLKMMSKRLNELLSI